MGVYIAEGGDGGRLLGLTCCHILILSKNINIDYIYHPIAFTKDILLLGKRPFNNLINSIKFRISYHSIVIEHWKGQIARFKYREQSTNAADVVKAKANYVVT